MAKPFFKYMDLFGAVGLVAGLFILVAVIELPFGIVQKVHDDNFRHHGKETVGVVVNQEDAGSPRSGGTIITFNYMVAGKQYTAMQRATNTNVDGSKQKIIYDPTRPYKAILANGGLTDNTRFFGMSLILGAIGLTLLAIGFIWKYIRGHKGSLTD